MSVPSLASWLPPVLLLSLAQAQHYSVNLCSTSDLNTDQAGSSGYINSPGYPEDISSHTATAATAATCSMHVISCPECHIQLQFEQLELPGCTELLPAGDAECIPGCDHLIISDMGNSRYVFNSDKGKNHTTVTRQFTLTYCQGSEDRGWARHFRISYLTIKKLEIYEGLPPPLSDELSTPQFFTSPNFPHKYLASGDIYKYLIRCLPMESESKCHIRLSFDDWSLLDNSKMIIYDGAHPINKTGAQQRPFIISVNPTLLIVFDSGNNMVYDYPFFGFKARLQFTNTQIWTNRPDDDYGEYYHSLNGGHFSYVYSDCWHDFLIDNIWVVTKFAEPDHFDQIMLRVDSAFLTEQDSLEIRAGNTSEAPLLWNTTSGFVGMDFISTTGIYVRLKLRCYPNRQFNAVFASFANASVTHPGSTEVCRYTDQLLCANKRCLASSLSCDGYNHCGDKTDEIGCTTQVPTVKVCDIHFVCHNGADWYCRREKCDGVWHCTDGSDEKDCNATISTEKVGTAQHWGTILPVVLICLVLSVIACIMVGYYTRRKSQQRRLQQHANQLATVSSGTAALEANGGGFTDSRWLFRDAPPTYEEAMGYYASQSQHSQGMMNLGYLRSDSSDYLARPPPYTAASDQRLPIRYIASNGPESPQATLPRDSDATTSGSTSSRPEPSSHPSPAESGPAIRRSRSPEDVSGRGHLGPSGLNNQNAGQNRGTTSASSDSGSLPRGATPGLSVATEADGTVEDSAAEQSSSACKASTDTDCEVVVGERENKNTLDTNKVESYNKTPDAVVNEVLEALENVTSEPTTSEQPHSGPVDSHCQGFDNPAMEADTDDETGQHSRDTGLDLGQHSRDTGLDLGSNEASFV